MNRLIDVDARVTLLINRLLETESPWQTDSDVACRYVLWNVIALSQ